MKKRFAFFAPSFMAYSESWMWRDAEMLKDKIVYIGCVNKPKTRYFNNVPVIGLSTPCLVERLKLKIRQIKTLNRSHVINHNFTTYNKQYKVNAVIINFLTMAFELAPSLHEFEGEVFIHCHGVDVTWDMHKHEDPDAPEYSQKYFDFIRTIADRAIFIANSLETRNRLQAIGVPAQKIRLKYFGVAIQSGNWLKKFDYAAPLKILYVGRFVDCKGPHMVIKAFEKACAFGLNAELTMIGAGPLLVMCQLLKKESAYKNRVFLLGEQSHEKVSDYMKSSHVLSLHSMKGSLTNQVEAFGVVFLEAMSYDLPVITGKSGGICEIVEDSVTGFLFEPGNTDEHARKLLEFASNPSLMKKMAIDAQYHVQKHFNLEQERQKYLTIIDS